MEGVPLPVAMDLGAVSGSGFDGGLLSAGGLCGFSVMRPPWGPCPPPPGPWELLLVLSPRNSKFMWTLEPMRASTLQLGRDELASRAPWPPEGQAFPPHSASCTVSDGIPGHRCFVSGNSSRQVCALSLTALQLWDSGHVSAGLPAPTVDHTRDSVLCPVSVLLQVDALQSTFTRN